VTDQKQKKELAVVKDICIMALVKIFTLMHQYPTLVREIVTPSLSPFATACLQILKPPVSSKVGKVPYSLVETIFEAISTLVVLYPTTLRQFAAKFRTEVRPYLVPTISDTVIVPASLQESSRRLAIRLHMTVAKGGDSTEWTRHVEELVKTLHSTADQVFRAVQENWESTIGHRPQAVNIDIEPQGGGDGPDQFPRWVGVQAGGERIIGLLDFIGDYLRYRTRAAVTIPITAITDIASRISSIKPPSPGKEKSDSGMMNPAIGREERDELWTTFPDIQIAALRTHITLAQRLGRSYIPLAPAALDQTLRVFQSTYRLPAARTTAFILVKEILQLCGPTLPKFTVDSLGLLMRCCCRDLLGAAGHLKKPKPQGASDGGVAKAKTTISQNADAFLPGKAQDDVISVSLSTKHLSAASSLLTTLFSHLPQQHIPSSLRTQMLKTAILSRNRDAQVASILHPVRDRSGRMPQVILPYLSRQFPQDESVEILRFSFRPMATGPASDFMDTDEAMAMEEVDDEEEAEAGSKTTSGFPFGRGFDTQMSNFSTAAASAAAPASITTHQFKSSSDSNSNSNSNPNSGSPFFLAQPQPQPQSSGTETEGGSRTSLPGPVASSPLKRKNSDATAEISVSSKRVEIDVATRPDITAAATTTSTTATVTATATQQTGGIGAKQGSKEAEEDDESDDESVHLNMELDSDDSEENDEEEEEEDQ
jgi:pre-rRNA-processing protein RIX1